jgi:hypothetical protein
MIKRIALLAITVGSFMANGAASASASTHALVSPSIMAKAARVDVCEEGGDWHYGSKFSEYAGGLGWLQATWRQWRAPSFPLYAYLATPAQQAWAMAHFVAIVEHGWWPDQVGCTGGY